MEDLWKKTLEEIELEVSKPRFVTFFKQTSLISLEGNIATISTPSSMVGNYLEKNYYALIKNILSKKNKSEVSLIFQTRSRSTKRADNTGPLFSNNTVKNSLRARSGRIKEEYTFDSFAVSDSNQLAFTSAQAVASDPGGKYNPLFIYGTVGVGKTHLMHSIANVIFQKKPTATIIYLTTEEFTNEVVEAIQFHTTQQLRKKFRNVDLLLLDDIQFLTGKDKVQEELFHTFNTLIDKKGQVVFSSDRPPHELKKIEARLASRFEGGLTVDIEPPEVELRTAILLIKSHKYGISLDAEMAKRAAGKIEDSRALEGFLLKLTSFLTASGTTEVTPQIIDKCLGKSKEAKTVAHPDDVISAVCDYFNIKTTQLKGARREASLVKPRHICMYLLKEDLGLPFVEIGNLLGGRDHTTVMHAVEKIKNMTSSSPHVNEDILSIKRRVTEGFAQ